MKIKEKLAGILKRLRHPKWVETVKDFRAWRLLRRVGDTCQANPFPVQVLLIVAYRLSLDVLYLKLISPLFAYAGFTTDLRLPYYACTVLTVLLFSPFLAHLHEQTSPSSAIVMILNYIYFIPLTSYCACKGTSPLFFLICMAYWAVLLFLQAHIPILHLAPLSPKHVNWAYGILTVLSAGFVLFISGKYTGFRLTLNIFDVYGIRAEATSYHIPGIFSYLLSFMGVMLSLLLLYWLQRKKYLISGALCVIFLFLFSIAAHKSLFFFLVLSLGCYFLLRPWMVRWLPGLLTLAAGAALLERKLIGSFYLMTYLFRRMMFIPAQLGEQYAAFFQDNPLNLFRFGIMGKLSFENIYSINIPYLIGESAGEYSSANNGLLGDLFANLPLLLGLILLPLILIICFRLLDAVSAGLPSKITMASCIYFAVTFANSSWSIVLLSHGFLVACFLLYFFPREERSLL